MKELFEIFFSFAKIGAVCFGGGLAMLPFFEREFVEKKKWVTEDDMVNYYAIGQCTPGIIAVNTSTFIGYKRKGVIGGIVATLGMIFPSVVIITIIAAVLNNFTDNIYVQRAFSGIRICVCVLVINAVAKLWKNSITSKASFCIFLAVLGLAVFTPVTSAWFVIGAGLLGFLLKGGKLK